MAISSLAFNLSYGTNINLYMSRKVIISQCYQIYIFVAAKFARIDSKDRHDTRHPAQQSILKNVKVKCPRFKRRTALGVEGSVVSFFERKYRRLVNVDMVRMSISTNWLDRQNGIRFKFANVFHNSPGY